MHVTIELNEEALRRLVLKEIREKLNLSITELIESDVNIEVKSKQNYKSEWEKAAFRAKVDKLIV